MFLLQLLLLRTQVMSCLLLIAEWLKGDKTEHKLLNTQHAVVQFSRERESFFPSHLTCFLWQRIMHIGTVRRFQMAKEKAYIFKIVVSEQSEVRLLLLLSL